MEKLVELVYYYNSHLEKGIIWIWLTTSIKEDGKEVHFDKEKEIRKYENYIISKKYWFIERLVKNDKIKSDGIKPREDLVKEIQIVDFKTGKTLWWKNQYSETEQLIMYLSIQDNPLEYLCSILKE